MKNINTDIDLSILCALNKNEQSSSTSDIADVCGCSTAYIQKIYDTFYGQLYFLVMFVLD